MFGRRSNTITGCFAVLKEALRLTDAEKYYEAEKKVDESIEMLKYVELYDHFKVPAQLATGVMPDIDGARSYTGFAYIAVQMGGKTKGQDKKILDLMGKSWMFTRRYFMNVKFDPGNPHLNKSIAFNALYPVSRAWLEFRVLTRLTEESRTFALERARELDQIMSDPLHYVSRL